MFVTSFKDIPIRFRTYLRGKPNRGILWCEICSADFGWLTGDMLDKVFGFAERNGQIFVVYRCPECQEIQYHHAETQLVEAYFDYMESCITTACT
jgi:hypothetical protein